MTQRQAKDLTRTLLVTYYTLTSQRTGRTMKLYRMIDGQLSWWSPVMLRWIESPLALWEAHERHRSGTMQKSDQAEVYRIQRQLTIDTIKRAAKWLRENKA